MTILICEDDVENALRTFFEKIQMDEQVLSLSLRDPSFRYRYSTMTVAPAFILALREIDEVELCHDFDYDNLFEDLKEFLLKTGQL